MKRNSVGPLGETELEILDIVWELGTVRVSDVLEVLRKRRKVAYTTVMTIMRKLADKGYLGYTEDGNTYVYSPARPADEVRRSLLGDLVDKVFRGSEMDAVRTLVRSETLSTAQLAELRALIDSMEDTADGTA